MLCLRIDRNESARTLMSSPTIMQELTDQDSLAAGSLNRSLCSGRELVGVDGDGSLDLAVVEYLDQGALLAKKTKGDDVLKRELSTGSRCEDLSNAVQTKNLILNAEDVGEAALRKPAVKGH